MLTKRLSLLDSRSMILPMSRVTHSMTYSLARQETSSRPSFLATFFRRFSRSSSTAKVILLSFLPVKSIWSCVTTAPQKRLKNAENRLKWDPVACGREQGIYPPCSPGPVCISFGYRNAMRGIPVSFSSRTAKSGEGRRMPMIICDRYVGLTCTLAAICFRRPLFPLQCCFSGCMAIY